MYRNTMSLERSNGWFRFAANRLESESRALYVDRCAALGRMRFISRRTAISDGAGLALARKAAESVCAWARVVFSSFTHTQAGESESIRLRSLGPIATDRAATLYRAVSS